MNNILKKLNEAYELVSLKQLELATKESHLNNREANLTVALKELDKERLILVALREQINPYVSLQEQQKATNELQAKVVKQTEALRVERERFDGWSKEQKVVIEGERLLNEQESKRLREKEQRMEAEIKARVKSALENINKFVG